MHRRGIHGGRLALGSLNGQRTCGSTERQLDALHEPLGRRGPLRASIGVCDAQREDREVLPD